MRKITYQDLTINRDRLVLDSFNLEVESGEFCVIVGPSGCGKSSLLEATAGLIDVEGKIKFDNIDITDSSPSSREIGYVFQDYALYPNMTVNQNIAFGLKIQKQKKTMIKKKTEEVLKTVRLEHKSNASVANLSGGEKQRVAIARSLVLNPKIMLMDEPLSSLDAHLRAELMKELELLHKEYKYTCIYVTHDQKEALTLADKVVLMNCGEIVQVGKPRELYQEPNSLFTLQFFNSQSLNYLDDSEECTIIARPSDVHLISGSNWEVLNINLTGEQQIVKLMANEEVRIASLSSNIEINIGDKFEIEYKKIYKFDKNGNRI